VRQIPPRHAGACNTFKEPAGGLSSILNKYVNLHIEQHNQHAYLQEYRVAPLAENLKPLWFQDGVRDLFFNAVKASINANRANFTDFDSVKDAYV
jgi:hypothetical protein